MKDGTTRQRAIRQDRHTMASMVMSYPVPCSAITTEEARQKLASWEARNIAYLRAKYGDQLKVVFAHEDEEHPHLHAWLLPDDPGADAKTLHPGKLAKEKVEAEEKKKGTPPHEAVKRGNRAYKAAMVAWQDEYYQAVAAPEGLTRIGPKRQRLSRAQYRSQKNAAEVSRESAACLVAGQRSRPGRGRGGGKSVTGAGWRAAGNPTRARWVGVVRQIPEYNLA